MRPLPLYDSLGNIFALLEWSDDLFDLQNISADFVKQALTPTPQAHGLLILVSGDPAHTYIFNADGSYGGFSGNGARIIAHILLHQHQTTQIHFLMGQRNIHATRDAQSITLSAPKGHIQPDLTLDVKNQHLIFHCVDTGNPHALFFADCSATEFYSLAPSLVKQIAPEGINLSLLKKINDQHYHLTPFERGVGPTPACSSAAIALISWLSPSQEITIDMPGGKLIATLQDEKVFLTAPWPQCDLPYQIENKHEKSYTL